MTKVQLLRTNALITSYGLDNPLYRGMGKESLDEYLATGTQTPKHGSLSTGTGICFTNDLDYALTFNAEGVLVTEQHLLGEFVDTREKGYEQAARERLRGQDYNGYELWSEIQKDNTIIAEPPRDRYTFVYRKILTRDKIISAIWG